MIEYKEISLPAAFIDEPDLAFGHAQTTDHPKDGLYLYGPVKPADRPDITIGIVGTADGARYFRDWARLITKTVKVPPRTKREKIHRLHLSNFPGIQEAFGLSIKPDALVVYTIKMEDIETYTAIENHHEAVNRTVDLFLEPIERHDKNEERSVDIWVFVVPEIVFERCRPQMGSKRKVTLAPGEYVKRQRTRSDLPLLEPVIDLSRENIFDDIPDFHRQVKARLLRPGHTSQLVRETTLAPNKFLNRAGYPTRGTQDAATIAWNLATGLFYKTQADPPWKIANMRPGVCYVGLVFKLIPNHPDGYACCAAQMFLSEGDGVVFRGANGPYLTDKKDFHLTRNSAKELIEKVLETYKSRFNDYPKELFIHGRTKFNNEEWNAFTEAAPQQTCIVGVRIKSSHGEMKLFREGDYPCLRGTAILLGNQDAYLWTSGYAPRIDTYVGPETPNPLYITVLRATGEMPSLTTVLQDIMGLTKINYNACNYSDSIPVTIRFADKVGDVLVMGSAKGVERQPFKFYI